MILFAKLFDQKIKRRYFNSGNQHGLFSIKTIASNYFYFYKNRVGEV